MAKKKKLKLVRVNGYPPIKGVMSKGYHYTESLLVDYGKPLKVSKINLKDNSQAKRTRDVRVIFTKKY